MSDLLDIFDEILDPGTAAEAETNLSKLGYGESITLELVVPEAYQTEQGEI